MKIKLFKEFDALKIIADDKKIFAMNITELEKAEIEEMINEYGDEVTVEAYFKYCAGRLKISFSEDSFVFCVPETTVYKAKKILNI